jgi:hypothetical protein
VLACRSHRFDRIDGAEEVRLDRIAIVVERQRPERPHADDTGDVEERVDRSELSLERSERRRDGSSIAHVANGGGDRDACGRELGVRDAQFFRGARE